jgi:hypothetical protein
MASGAFTPRQRGRLGGLTRAATAPSRQEITRDARAARWRKYVDQVRETLPDITDEAELLRRAQLLLRADMCRLSAKAAAARKARAAGDAA